MMRKRVTYKIGEHDLILETGYLAKNIMQPEKSPEAL